MTELRVFLVEGNWEWQRNVLGPESLPADRGEQCYRSGAPDLIHCTRRGGTGSSANARMIPAALWVGVPDPVTSEWISDWSEPKADDTEDVLVVIAAPGVATDTNAGDGGNSPRERTEPGVETIKAHHEIWLLYLACK